MGAVGLNFLSATVATALTPGEFIVATQTDPLASGLSTSEGKLALALVVVGIFLEVAFAKLTELSQQFPHLTWLAVATLVTGAGMQLVAVLGYNKNRSTLKSNIIVAGAQAGSQLVLGAIATAVAKNLPAPAANKEEAVTKANALTAALANASGAALVVPSIATPPTVPTGAVGTVPVHRP